jgi:undecaprenyl-diphosphatase
MRHHGLPGRAGGDDDRTPFVVGLLLLLMANLGFAAGFDHRVAPTNSGIWARQYTAGLEDAVIATEIGGALWLGGESELGRTFWQTIDSSIFSSATAQGLKWAFGRERPTQTNSPNQWFKGGHAQSFPSGEVTLQASFVTPFIVNYAARDPWVWVLEILPAYDAVARVKNGAHWQTDVLAGWALGTGFGYLATTYKTPVFLSVLPRGVSVGVHTSW